MAMSNLYSKIATKPVKRTQQENTATTMSVSVSQTNAWMNGKLSVDMLVFYKFGGKWAVNDCCL